MKVGEERGKEEEKAKDQKAQPQQGKALNDHDGDQNVGGGGVVVVKEQSHPQPNSNNLVLGHFSAGVTNFLSGFTFPRNKKKISMTNSLGGGGGGNRRRGGGGPGSGAVTLNSRKGGSGYCEQVEAGLRSSHRIRSVNNLIGSNIHSCSRSRERKVSSSSSSAKSGGGVGRIVDGSAEHLNQQPRTQTERKLVRIIDHHLDW